MTLLNTMEDSLNRQPQSKERWSYKQARSDGPISKPVCCAIQLLTWIQKYIPTAEMHLDLCSKMKGSSKLSGYEKAFYRRPGY